MLSGISLIQVNYYLNISSYKLEIKIIDVLKNSNVLLIINKCKYIYIYFNLLFTFK